MRTNISYDKSRNNGDRETPDDPCFVTPPPRAREKNDSLRQEFPGLMEDVEPFLALAREAFGNEPDAVNLWIGDERSLSAVHKDHYEVIFCFFCLGSFLFASGTFSRWSGSE